MIWVIGAMGKKNYFQKVGLNRIEAAATTNMTKLVSKSMQSKIWSNLKLLGVMARLLRGSLGMQRDSYVRHKLGWLKSMKVVD